MMRGDCCLCSAGFLWPLCRPQVLSPVRCRRTGENFNTDGRVKPSVKPYERGLKALVRSGSKSEYTEMDPWGPAKGSHHTSSWFTM